MTNEIGSIVHTQQQQVINNKTIKDSSLVDVDIDDKSFLSGFLKAFPKTDPEDDEERNAIEKGVVAYSQQGEKPEEFSETAWEILTDFKHRLDELEENNHYPFVIAGGHYPWGPRTADGTIGTGDEAIDIYLLEKVLQNHEGGVAALVIEDTGGDIAMTDNGNGIFSITLKEVDEAIVSTSGDLADAINSHQVLSSKFRAVALVPETVIAAIGGSVIFSPGDVGYTPPSCNPGYLAIIEDSPETLYMCRDEQVGLMGQAGDPTKWASSTFTQVPVEE